MNLRFLLPVVMLLSLGSAQAETRYGRKGSSRQGVGAAGAFIPGSRVQGTDGPSSSAGTAIGSGGAALSGSGAGIGANAKASGGASLGSNSAGGGGGASGGGAAGSDVAPCVPSPTVRCAAPASTCVPSPTVRCAAPGTGVDTNPTTVNTGATLPTGGVRPTGLNTNTSFGSGGIQGTSIQSSFGGNSNTR